MIKSLEELNAEHAAAVAKLEAEHALAVLMPAAPDSVQIGKGRRPSWIIYRKRSLTAALELMALFHCVPLYRFKGTFCELVPDGCADEKAEQVAGPFACALDVDQGEGFGPDAKLYFYAGVADPALAPQSRLVRVVIDIDGPDYIGGFSSLGASISPIMGGRFGREIVGYQKAPNQALAALSDNRVKWADSDKKSARFTYLFCADQEAAAPMSEQTHALGQLRNLRDEFQPPAELIESTARADYYRIPGVKGRSDVYAAVKPGGAAPANVAGYYDLDSLKRLKGDAK